MDAEGGNRRKKQKVKKDEVEANLEELLFGEVNFTSKDAKGKSQQIQSTDEELSIIIDRTAATAPPNQVWVDDDDEELLVDLTQTDRLKKLKYSKSSSVAEERDRSVKMRTDVMTGRELSEALRERYQMNEVQWAMTSNEDNSEPDILMHTDSMVSSSAPKGSALPRGRVQLQRIMDANAAEPGTDGITSCQFSASGELLVTGGMDRWIRVFKLNEEESNEKVLGTRFNEMPILDSKLLGNDSSELIVVGRKPYFYSYDLESGIVTKIRSLMGSGRGLNSHETMSVCPTGSKLAFAGAGGYVHILSGSQKTWMIDIKMNTAARAVSFASDNLLLTGGLDADLYLWDLRHTARCVSRIRNEDGTCISSLKASSRASASGDSSAMDYFTAVGSESGVVSLYNITCHYKDVIKKGIQEFSDTDVVLDSVTQKPLRSVMNLTTKITSMAVHPSGQMMSVASDQKRDQLKLIHIGSGTVFENWPTDNTPLRRVQCMDFSPTGFHLAIGNNRGRVLLYKLNHFDASK